MKDKKKTSAKAVALMYGGKIGKAPTVAAKGSGEVAKKIIELAKEHKIPVRQDADLIAMLTKVDVLEEIPENLYTAVAEILAFIYSVNQRQQHIATDTGTIYDQGTLHGGSGNDTPANQIGSGSE